MCVEEKTEEKKRRFPQEKKIGNPLNNNGHLGIRILKHAGLCMAQQLPSVKWMTGIYSSLQGGYVNRHRSQIQVAIWYVQEVG